ncbi:hypothetical protein MuYL_3761 [Mucilaginibacter xinganensis]|uniref:Uncharacterized protein n=1 Tax=Mucilaginibacter xinganensis TaxID=1234841 RepID=A0A223P0N3_9SPHI|nr:hypothetical protein MuYL_3761 [Mucilaginibacter xinganensis]
MTTVLLLYPIPNKLQYNRGRRQVVSFKAFNNWLHTLQGFLLYTRHFHTYKPFIKFFAIPKLAAYKFLLI